MAENLAVLTTEQVNDKTSHIDMCSTYDILRLINEEDMSVPSAVKKELPNIEKAVNIVVERFKKGGRLFYVGAGTSGRIGILDASECPPTYGTKPELVQGIIAGGDKAVFKAVEGAEDSEELGRQAVIDKGINDKDVVIGITASGRAPFVIGALREARQNGAAAIGISNNKNSIIKNEVEVEICPIVGPEVVMGSTRMKAGTSQKLVLNMISTTAMIKLGKVYGNLMVDVQATNIKLKDRCIRIVMYATGTTKELAEEYLDKSDYNPKLAIVMLKLNKDREFCEDLLKAADGFVSKAIENY